MIEYALTPMESATLRGDLARAHQELRGAIALLGPERWTQTPVDGGWSAAEIAEHVLIVEAMFLTRVRMMLEMPPGGPLDEEDAIEHQLRTLVPSAGKRTAPEQAASFLGLTEEMVSKGLERSAIDFARVLKQAEERPAHAIVWPHKGFGPLTVYLWLTYLPLHTLRHAGQMGRLV